jgi:hypothetical protein
MKLWLFCLMLGVLPGFGEDRRQEPVPVTLYTKFEHEVPPAIRAAIQQEVSAIMDPIGFTFDWRSLAVANGSDVSVELAVITFKGVCSAANLATRASNPGALGWTHVSDGVILPFSDVDCNRIRVFLQKELLHRDSRSRDELFGRAVGRVLAHELYHIFANTSQHGSCGVGKAAYSVQELLSNDFRFEASESKALRARTRTHIEMAPATVGGS